MHLEIIFKEDTPLPSLRLLSRFMLSPAFRATYVYHSPANKHDRSNTQSPCFLPPRIPEFYCQVIWPRNQFELGAWWPCHWGNPALVWRQSILHHCSVWKTNTEGFFYSLSSRDQSGGNLRKAGEVCVEIDIVCQYLKKFTILYQGPKIWNSLPVTITSLKRFPNFKNKLLEFLIK